MYPFKSPAKINVGLFVSQKRNDGYHLLDTLFFGINLFDTLHIQKSETFNLTCSTSKIPTDDRNIITKAFKAFIKRHPTNSALKIHLQKELPSEAGIGGASGNAALILWLLNQIHNCPLSQQVLLQLALDIGADVPFFLQHSPCFAQGIGEVFTPLHLKNNLHLVLIKPKFSIKTSEAFSYLDTVPRSRSSIDQPKLISLLQSNCLEQLNDVVSNDFELIPGDSANQIAIIKQQLLNKGASFASLSGSGSCIYGLFSDSFSATMAHEYFINHYESYLCSTLLNHSPFFLNQQSLSLLLSNY